MEPESCITRFVLAGGCKSSDSGLSMQFVGVLGEVGGRIGPVRCTIPPASDYGRGFARCQFFPELAIGAGNPVLLCGVQEILVPRNHLVIWVRYGECCEYCAAVSGNEILLCSLRKASDSSQVGVWIHMISKARTASASPTRSWARR